VAAAVCKGGITFVHSTAWAVAAGAAAAVAASVATVAAAAVGVALVAVIPMFQLSHVCRRAERAGAAAAGCRALAAVVVSIVIAATAAAAAAAAWAAIASTAAAARVVVAAKVTMSLLSLTYLRDLLRHKGGGGVPAVRELADAAHHRLAERGVRRSVVALQGVLLVVDVFVVSCDVSAVSAAARAAWVTGRLCHRPRLTLLRRSARALRAGLLLLVHLHALLDVLVVS